MLTRRSMLGVLAVAALSGAGCSIVKPADLSPAEIISKASDALKAVKSAHFKVSSSNGMMAIGTGLVAQSIEGDVAQPDRLQGKAIGTFGRVTVEISFIIVGSNLFITNPITKKWEPIPGGGSAPNLLDPDKGASLLLRQVANLKKLSNEPVAGVDCYHLAGDVSASLIAGMVGGTSDNRTLSGDVWIATTDFLLRQIHLVGPVAANEPPAIERVLALSNFNESVVIDPPA